MKAERRPAPLFRQLTEKQRAEAWKMLLRGGVEEQHIRERQCLSCAAEMVVHRHTFLCPNCRGRA